MSRTKMNLNNLNHQLVVAGLTGMVDEDGLTPHEAFEVVEDIKQNIFHALAEIRREKVSGG
jgi:hypothetical protein